MSPLRCSNNRGGEIVVVAGHRIDNYILETRTGLFKIGGAA